MKSLNNTDMRTNEILTRFNKEGIFPTDEQLQIVLDETGTKNKSIYDLELDLLEIASRDESHPYHPMTKSTTPPSEAMLEFEKWIEENAIEVK